MARAGLLFTGKPDTIGQDTRSNPLEAVESFETYRTYLFAIAYRMLGSVMDAEDMVQETYLRYQAVRPETVNSLKAFLTTILTRLCIDQLHRAYKQREIYLGPWLPEPVLTANTGAVDVEEAAVMEESLSIAFLTMLEQLQPAERAVFLLREVVDYDYADIATFVGKKEAACRQLFSRARKRLAENQRPNKAAVQVHERLLMGFIQAVRSGDQSALMELLAEDASLVADGGGKNPRAATRPILGSQAVAQFATRINFSFLPTGYSVELSEVNSQPAVIVRDGKRALVVMTIEVEEQRVKTVRFMANPEKLGHL